MTWFKSWFDTDYYHTLYKHRDEHEAELFIDNIYSYLKIKEHQSILDLGCGKGRHAIYMAQKINQVLGLDLSPNSIELAKEKASQLDLTTSLDFIVGDMRDFHLDRKFDYIMNLFTSFGYFDTKEENLQVVSSISKHQETGGIVVIDFLNSDLVKSNGEMKEIKTIDNIEFSTHKYIQNNHVYKSIKVIDNGIESNYQERVQLFQKTEIVDFFSEYNYICTEQFGDYKLNPYSPSSSRQILIFKKK